MAEREDSKSRKISQINQYPVKERLSSPQLIQRLAVVNLKTEAESKQVSLKMRGKVEKDEENELQEKKKCPNQMKLGLGDSPGTQNHLRSVFLN